MKIIENLLSPMVAGGLLFIVGIFLLGKNIVVIGGIFTFIGGIFMLVAFLTNQIK